MSKDYDTIIVGAGPAGIFCATELIKRSPSHKILIIEKGESIRDRKCPRGTKTNGKCVNCNPCDITTGWGGAGAFSDGKLTYAPEVGGWLSDIIGADRLNDYYTVVDSVWAAEMDDSTLYEGDDKELRRQCQRAGITLIKEKVRHLGTDRTTEILAKMYDTIVGNPNVTVLHKTAVRDLIVKGGRIMGVHYGKIIGGGGNMPVAAVADNVVVAPGRAGSDWLAEQMRALKIPLTTNPVDIGVRVETSAAWADAITEAVYEPKMVYYTDCFDDKVRTFCVNPRGLVVTESYGDVVTVNGHSNHGSKTENTNFALLVSTNFTEPFHQPTEYGKHIARLANMIGDGGVIVQRLGDLKKGRRTTVNRLKKGTVQPSLDAVAGDLSFVLPHRHLLDIVEMLEKMDEVAPGIGSKDTLLYGVEAKFYSSRPKLIKGFETPIKGLYVAGDGAGITRGLSQASINGILVAEQIVS